MNGYEYTHLTWRAVNADGSVTTYVHTIHDRERAADEIRELALNPGVFALRAVQYPMADADDHKAVRHLGTTDTTEEF